MASDDQLEPNRNIFFRKQHKRFWGGLLVIAPIPIASAAAGDLSWGDAGIVIACAVSILVGVWLFMSSLEF